MTQCSDRDRVHSPMTQRCDQISARRIVKESGDEEQRGANDQDRAEPLNNSWPTTRSSDHIGRQSKVEQPRKQYKDVPRAIKEPQASRHANHVIQIDVHVLPGEQEDDENQYAEY